MSGDIFATPPGWDAPRPPTAPPAPWSPPPAPSPSPRAGWLPALALWIAATLLVGIGGAVARRDDGGASTAAAPTTTTKDHVSHQAPSTTSSTAADLDFSDALVDAQPFGYDEIPASVSGPLDDAGIDQLAMMGGAPRGADAAAQFRSYGYDGGYLRTSRSADGSTVLEQIVLGFDGSRDTRIIAQSLIAGISAVASDDGQPFDVPIGGATGEAFSVSLNGRDGVGAVVEHKIGQALYVEFVLVADGTTDAAITDVLAIAQAQVDHG